MKRYAITSKLASTIGSDDYIYAQVVNGNRLAELYGFSDCTGFELIQAMEACLNGRLLGRRLT